MGLGSGLRYVADASGHMVVEPWPFYALTLDDLPPGPQLRR